MDLSQLQEKFSNGTTPSGLNGFYKGTLLLLLPRTLPEHLAEYIRRIYVPWLGKCFYQTKHSGDNLLPESTRMVLRFYPGKITTGQKEHGGFHAFPFITSTAKGISGDKKVLRLNYNLPENPYRARGIIDELVAINDHLLLGKVYLSEKETFRHLGFFQLNK